MNLPRRTRIAHQSKSFAHKKRNHTIRWAVILAICFVIVLVGSSYLFSLNAFKVNSIQVFGADGDLASSTMNLAETAIQGKYLGLFAHSDMFIYPKQKMISEIKSLSPQIDSVTINRDGWHTLIISISQKAPAAVVCTNLPDWNNDQLTTDSTDDSCYFVDQQGFVFESAPTFSGHVYNRYYIPALADLASSSQTVLGLYATSTETFTALQNIFNNLRAAQIDINGILVKDGGEYEAYVGSPTTTIVYFNSQHPFQDQTDNLISFWTHMISGAHTKGKSISFDYIDVRYGSNIFYKLIK